MSKSSSSPRTHYEILGIERTADAKAIRQAYLRASLKHHPDKNPGDRAEEAKARFIEIGQAYDVLKDPVQRASYDSELRAGTWRKKPSSPQVYDNYRDAFDAHVAGLSEEELHAAMGAAALVASLVGSLVGARASRESSLLSTAGSLVGSMAASQTASNLVKSLHQQSVERVAYQEERRSAIARGEVPPDAPIQKNHWKDFMPKTSGSTKSSTGNTSKTTTNSEAPQTGNTDNSWSDKVNKAMDSVKQKAAAAAVSAAMASTMSNDGKNSVGTIFMSAVKAATEFHASTSQSKQSKW